MKRNRWIKCGNVEMWKNLIPNRAQLLPPSSKIKRPALPVSISRLEVCKNHTLGKWATHYWQFEPNTNWVGYTTQTVFTLYYFITSVTASKCLFYVPRRCPAMGVQSSAYLKISMPSVPSDWNLRICATSSIVNYDGISSAQRSYVT